MKRFIAFTAVTAILLGLAWASSTTAQVDGNYIADYGIVSSETLTLSGAVSDTSGYLDIRPAPHLTGRIAAVITSASNDSGVAYNVEASVDRSRWFTVIDSTRGIPDGSNVSRGWDFETGKLYRYWRVRATNASADTCSVTVDWIVR